MGKRARWLVVVGWWTAIGLSVAAGSSSAAAPIIEKAQATGDGRVEIFEAARREPRSVAKAPDQVSIRALAVSPDRVSVGWLAEMPTCCTSYPVPLALVVYRTGLPVLRLGNGLAIWGWGFRERGSQVAFVSSPTHGDFPGTYQLYDVRSGRLMATWTGRTGDQRAPAWTAGLDR